MVMRTEDIEDFGRRLLRAFPPRPYHGLVSTHDECDDGIWSEDEGWDEKRIVELVALFDPAQKRLIEDFLRLIVSDEE